MSEATLPRAEYPRPRFVRGDWLNLNGTWEFAFDDADEGLDSGWWRETHRLGRTITVPFPYPLSASGIGEPDRHEVVWYAREIDLPAEYTGCQIWLRFEAVNETAQVWLNGEPLGENHGGHVPFAFEITGQLRPGRNRLTLRVLDRREPSASTEEGASAFPSCPGIWRAVWLEPTSPTHIDRLRVIPSVETETVRLELQIAGGARAGLQVRARALLEGREVAQRVADVERAGVALDLPLRRIALWSPGHPFLYDVELILLLGGMAVDRVKSYFGMREMAVEEGRLLLNGDPLEAPAMAESDRCSSGLQATASDDQLRQTVAQAKASGPGIRLSGAAADPRGLLWCDRLGLVVWEEMPTPEPWGAARAEACVEAWARVVERDAGHPSIVAWSPVPQGWVTEDAASARERRDFVEGVTALTCALDGTRPVIECADDTAAALPPGGETACQPPPAPAAIVCEERAESRVETEQPPAPGRRPQPLAQDIVSRNEELFRQFRERQAGPARSARIVAPLRVIEPATPVRPTAASPEPEPHAPVEQPSPPALPSPPPAGTGIPRPVRLAKV